VSKLKEMKWNGNNSLLAARFTTKLAIYAPKHPKPLFVLSSTTPIFSMAWGEQAKSDRCLFAYAVK